MGNNGSTEGCRAATEASWCDTCGTRHLPEEFCPGELRATGAERPGWKAVYKTPHGGESYRVLLYPAGESRCARIITEPNVVWTGPGGKTSMKFVGRTFDEAERQAIAFVEDTCRRKGHRRIEDLPAGVSFAARVDAPRQSRTPTRVPRKTHSVAARWGVGRPTAAAETGNLSADGLFVVTPAPPAPGTSIRISLDLDACKVPLKGRVVWIRERPAPDLPPGMGVHLIRPPALYVGYVEALA